MVDKNRGRLHEDGYEGNRALPFADAAQLCKLAVEDYCGWNIDEVFGNQDSCAHEDFEELALIASRSLKCEPFGIDKGPSAAYCQPIFPQRAIGYLTSSPEASYGMLSKVDSPSPNIQDRKSTIVIWVGVS